MNAKQLIAAVTVFAAAGAVFAGDLQSFPDLENFVSSKTRAEVRAEIAPARAAGTLVRNDVNLAEPVLATGGKARDVVRGEAVQHAKGRQFDAGYDIGA